MKVERPMQLHSRRRVVRLQVMEGNTEKIAQLERVLAPTFAEVPPAWLPEEKDDAEKAEPESAATPEPQDADAAEDEAEGTEGWERDG